MIRKLENPLETPKILDLARIVPNTPMDVLEKMILKGISDKDSAIYIYERESNVTGFIFASQETWGGKLVAFIQFCVVKPDEYEKAIGFELLTKVRIWAMERGIEDIITVVKRDPKGFMRKYNFIQEGVVLKRKVKGEKP